LFIQGGHWTTNQQVNSFAVRGQRQFNKMPAKIHNIVNTGIIKFKNKLDSYQECIPDKPVIHGYPHL
jgi:hypothetical protein